MFQRFNNRKEGGKSLAEELAEFKNREDVVVLALPRGGVPVAFEVTNALNAPLDVFLVRKLGVPFREELAFGAIATGGITVLNESLIKTFRIPKSLVEEILAKEEKELKRRERLYNAERPANDLRNKIIIVIDDGLATGATMRAALVAIRQHQPKQIIVAAPVCSKDVCETINERSDEICICVKTPDPFYGVGMWYEDFTQTTDEEVCYLLTKANEKFARNAFGRKQAA